MSSTTSNAPRTELPRRFVTQTLPWLSIAEAAAAVAGLEFLDLGRIGCRKARHVRAEGVGHPDPVLLVDAEVERRDERLARLDRPALADDPALGRIALGEVDELALRDAQDPDIAARRDDHALHQSELAVEGDAVRTGVSDLPFLSNFEIDMPP